MTDQTKDSRVEITVLDPEATHRIQVKDLTIHVRTPGLTDRLRLLGSRADSILEKRLARVDYESLVEIVASLIVRIDGWEDYEPIAVLQGIRRPPDFYEIVAQINQLAFLSEDERKK